MTTDPDYRAIADFREELRRFLHATERATTAHGLTPATYDLLLMVRAGEEAGATIGSLARRLGLAANSVTELVDRAEASGLVRRGADPSDGRVTRVSLTRGGHERLAAAVAELDAERLHLLMLLGEVHARLRDSR